MSDRLAVEISEHVAHVTLNRPGKHNAVDKGMFDAFIEVGEALAGDPSVRAVVLGGAGDNFCAGIDVGTFTGGGVTPELMRPVQGSAANCFQSAAYVWRSMPVPVIAALKGVVFGAGLQIALGADLRVAAPDTRMSIMETKWGIIPDMAVSTLAPALLSYDRAAELTWTGRIVAAEEARSLGLVTLLAEDSEATARAMAADIAARSPDAVRAAKRLLQASYEERDEKLLALEARLQLEVMAGSNFREAVAANVEKRPPAFADPPG